MNTEDQLRSLEMQLETKSDLLDSAMKQLDEVKASRHEMSATITRLMQEQYKSEQQAINTVLGLAAMLKIAKG